MFWLVIFAPLIAVLLLVAFVNWRGKRKYKKYNLDHTPEQYVSDKNQMNNAAAWTNAVRDHHDGGGGGY